MKAIVTGVAPHPDRDQGASVDGSSTYDSEDWLARLDAPQHRDAAAAELRRILRAGLARSFGAQLSNADLDDLTQDAVARSLEKRAAFRGDSKFTTWATAIAVRLALGLLRKRRHAAAAMDAVLADGREAIDALAPVNLQADDAAAVLRRAIEDALTPTQREALLAELGGLPLMEIARRTGRSRGALYKLLHDARKRLLTHLREAGYGPADLLPDAEVTA